MSTQPFTPDEVRHLTLAAFADGDLDELAEQPALIHLSGVNPGRALLELAAELFLLADATRSAALDLHEPPRTAPGRGPRQRQHARQKRRYALTAAVLIATGAEPEDTSCWCFDDLWTHALNAYLRAAADTRGVTPQALAAELHRQP